MKLPEGYHIDWAGEYESQKRSSKRLAMVLPITMLVICMILYTMFNSFKWVALILANVAMAPIGGCWRSVAHRHALQRVVGRRLPGAVRRFGADRRDHAGVHQPTAGARPRVLDAAIEGSVQRLRPIIMTMLVASLGLLPAALSRGIGSDSQRPFAIVIVGGLVAALILGVYLLPTLYVWVAGERDALPPPEEPVAEG